MKPTRYFFTVCICMAFSCAIGKSNERSFASTIAEKSHPSEKHEHKKCLEIVKEIIEN